MQQGGSPCCVPWGGALFSTKLMLANVAKVFDEQGRLTDPAVNAQVATYRDFAQFVARYRNNRSS
jgi:hypothetical protein